jgi:hypothetical protein
MPHLDLLLLRELQPGNRTVPDQVWLG